MHLFTPILLLVLNHFTKALPILDPLKPISLTTDLIHLSDNDILTKRINWGGDRAALNLEICAAGLSMVGNACGLANAIAPSEHLRITANAFNVAAGVVNGAKLRINKNQLNEKEKKEKADAEQGQQMTTLPSSSGAGPPVTLDNLRQRPKAGATAQVSQAASIPKANNAISNIPSQVHQEAVIPKSKPATRPSGDKGKGAQKGQTPPSRGQTPPLHKANGPQKAQSLSSSKGSRPPSLKANALQSPKANGPKANEPQTVQTPPLRGQTPPSRGQTPSVATKGKEKEPQKAQTPPSRGQTPPSRGQTPPSRGQTPPSRASRPPSPKANGPQKAQSLSSSKGSRPPSPKANRPPSPKANRPPSPKANEPQKAQTPPLRGQTPPSRGQTPPLSKGNEPQKSRIPVPTKDKGKGLQRPKSLPSLKGNGPPSPKANGLRKAQSLPSLKGNGPQKSQIPVATFQKHQATVAGKSLPKKGGKRSFSAKFKY